MGYILLFLGSIGVILLSQWGFNNREMLKIERRFRKTFGGQQLVDAHLTKLACDADEVFQLERDKYRTKNDTVEDFERQIETVKGQVASFKKRFWEAHNLARGLGYFVRGKIVDYLPQEPSALKRSGAGVTVIG